MPAPPRLPRLFVAAASALALAALSASDVTAQQPGSGAAADAKLALIVHDLRGCARLLAPSDVRILVLTVGFGGRHPQSLADAARQTGQTPAAVAQQEITAVRHLEIKRRQGQCQSQPTSPASSTTGATRTAASGAESSGTDWTKPSVLGLLGLAALCSLVLVVAVVRSLRVS